MMSKGQKDAMRVAIEDIAAERLRQHDKWGEQNIPDGTSSRFFRGFRDVAQRICNERMADNTVTWRHVAGEEWAEVLAEQKPIELRRELVQLAAVLCQWIECIDRKDRK